MECLFCARGECEYGERCMRSQRAREMRTLRLDSDYESGSEENSGGGDGGSVSSEGGDVCGAGDRTPARDTDDDEAWQQVRDGAVALQQDTSPAGLLQRDILEEQVVLCDGRYELLRLGVDDEDDDEAVGADAEVDTPGFSFNRRECGLAGQPRDGELETPAQARVEDVLAAYYFREEAVESRRRAAEWAADGWQQPSDWGSCLDWIADQWGATEDTASPRTKDLLMRLQFSSRPGLVGVLLWQQRQRSCTSAVRQWQDWCSGQVAALGSCLGAVWPADMAQVEQQQRIQGSAEEEGSEGEEVGGHRACLGSAAGRCAVWNGRPEDGARCEGCTRQWWQQELEGAAAVP